MAPGPAERAEQLLVPVAGEQEPDDDSDGSDGQVAEPSGKGVCLRSAEVRRRSVRLSARCSHRPWSASTQARALD